MSNLDGNNQNKEESGHDMKTPARPDAPVRTATGTILVDWYGTNDPANPQNWSGAKKSFVALQINLYTFAVYTSSSIYISSIPWVPSCDVSTSDLTTVAGVLWRNLV